MTLVGNRKMSPNWYYIGVSFHECFKVFDVHSFCLQCSFTHSMSGVWFYSMLLTALISGVIFYMCLWHMGCLESHFRLCCQHMWCLECGSRLEAGTGSGSVAGSRTGIGFHWFAFCLHWCSWIAIDFHGVLIGFHCVFIYFDWCSFMFNNFHDLSLCYRWFS